MECLFTCLGKKFCLQKNYFCTILDANTLKKGKTNILYLKILKKSDKMNLTRFNTLETLYWKISQVSVGEEKLQ